MLRVWEEGAGAEGAAEDVFTLGWDGELLVKASSTAGGFQWCKKGQGLPWVCFKGSISRAAGWLPVQL